MRIYQPSERRPSPISPVDLLSASAIIAAFLAVGLGIATVGRLSWIIYQSPDQLSTLLSRLTMDERLIKAMGNTARLTVWALAIQFSLPLLLVRYFKKISEPLGVFLILPILLAPSTAAVACFLWFSPAIGPLQSWLTTLDIEVPLWFVNTGPMTTLAVMVDSWQWLPFISVVLVFQTGRIPDRFFDQAKIEGASQWFIWWKVTIPTLLPTVAVLLAIRLLDLIRLYDVVYVLFGGGGPGNAIETLSIYSLKLTFQPGNEAYGALVTLAYLLVALVCLLLILKVPSVRRILPWTVTHTEK